MSRLEVRVFGPETVDPAAALLAQRHRLHRLSQPALNPEFEQPSSVRPEIEALATQANASGAAVFVDRELAAYVLGTQLDPTWGPNVWIEAAGHAALSGEPLRHAYAAAARRWVDEGRTNHFVIVPAGMEMLVESWFSLGFGQQQVHAVREHPRADFEPAIPPALTVRPQARPDIPTLAELELVLPRHQMASPVFSRLAPPSLEQTIAEFEEEFEDPRFAVFVAEHDGRVIGSAVGCSLEVSSSHKPLMRPRSAGFLGFAAVLPEARGLGAGRALAETVMAWSRDAGYEWFATDWRSTNIEGNRTWTRLGFEPTFYRLHRAIV